MGDDGRFAFAANRSASVITSGGTRVTKRLIPHFKAPPALVFYI
jgi:hypothetical protein